MTGYEKVIEGLTAVKGILESLGKGEVKDFAALQVKASEAQVKIEESVKAIEEAKKEAEMEPEKDPKKEADPDPKKKPSEEADDSTPAKKPSEESVKLAADLAIANAKLATIESGRTADKLMDEFKIAASARTPVREHLVLNYDSEDKMKAYLESHRALSGTSLFGSPEKGVEGNGSKAVQVIRESGLPMVEEKK